ncbi:hypothetical protein HID58_078953 [Brassica napus]|uniref:Uncharacterized protein n=1 Tax=Brassica napus TaxID=3708 RepID=A0ABQ7XEH1_BRANA|nr:hypothetical protein HID58_078953 [Brassica napus]
MVTSKCSGCSQHMICFNGVPYACPDKCDIKCKENGFNGGICSQSLRNVVAIKGLRHRYCLIWLSPPSILSYPVKPPPSICLILLSLPHQYCLILLNLPPS